MDLPNLPTESLYKFQALSGLFLVVGTLVYLFKLLDENWRLLIEVETEINIYNLDLELLRDHPDFKALLNDDDAAVQEEIPTKESVKNASFLLGPHKKSRIQVEGKKKLAIYLTKRIVTVLCLGILIMVSGWLWGYIGFTRWQTVQNDIDATIHEQAVQAIMANMAKELTPIERIEAEMRADSSKGK